jgi:UDP-N-acetylmuramoyl-L-alanyl-D-glutamate--2,6-diaminopimelate ligase
MGRIATELADVVYATSDNPRSEDPETILDEVLAGASGPAEIHREVDRTEAITEAIAGARDKDLVLLAGKGHETTQEVAGTFLDLDDRTVALRALDLRSATC